MLHQPQEADDAGAAREGCPCGQRDPDALHDVAGVGGEHQRQHDSTQGLTHQPRGGQDAARRTAAARRRSSEVRFTSGVACWGTGDLQQYDVSDPFNPKLTGKVRIDDRPVHSYTMTNDIAYIPPKARVY